MRNKVFVLGLDGATWDVFLPMIDEGIMPNLKNLMELGISGILKSTIPPVTATAWTTFQTGVNPGKHGIYDFIKFDRLTNSPALVNSSDIPLKTLWEIVSEANKISIAVNVPMTYPPRKVNGVIIGGLLSPSVNSKFTYPSNIYNDIIEEIGDYEIYIDHKVYLKRGYKDFIDKSIDVEKKRLKAALYLMQRYEWDLFMLQNQSLDLVQHLMWNCIDKEHPSFSKERRNYLLNFYRGLDENIGIIIKNLSPEARLFIISDHGFGPLFKRIDLNSWLLDRGYLALKPFSKTINSLSEFVKKFDIFQLRNKLFSYTAQDKIKRSVSQKVMIDWKNTKAFTLGEPTYQQIYLNSNSLGLDLTKIVRELEDLKDPESNTKVIKHVFKKENIYHGEYVSHAPDLVIEPEKGYAFCLKSAIGRGKYFEKVNIERENNGRHERSGVILAYGKNIKRSFSTSDWDLVDLAPNILKILGVPISSYMDGKLKNDIYEKPNFCEEVTFSKEQEMGPEGKEVPPYSKKEAKVIEKRLRDIGYL